MSLEDIKFQNLYDITARIITRTLNPNEYFDIQEPHSFLRIETGVNVNVLINFKQPSIYYPAGTGFNFDDSHPVQNSRVVNNDAGAQTITVYYGFGSFIDTRSTISGSVNVTNLAGTKLITTPNANTGGSNVYALTNAAVTACAFSSTTVQEIHFQNTGLGDIYIGATAVLATLQAQGLILSPREHKIITGSPNLYAASVAATGELRRIVLSGV